jgi:hypothetical protein
MPSTIRARDWDHFFYIRRHERPRLRKSEVAAIVLMSSQEFSKALDPSRYNPSLTDEQVSKIAELWNQSEAYVRRIYPRRKESSSAA